MIEDSFMGKRSFQEMKGDDKNKGDAVEPMVRDKSCYDLYIRVSPNAGPVAAFCLNHIPILFV